MNWAELFAFTAGDEGRERDLLDRALAALLSSNDCALHAAIVAAVPNTLELCEALDASAIAVPDDAERQIARRTVVGTSLA
jgi:hypothetical protein